MHHNDDDTFIESESNYDYVRTEVQGLFSSLTGKSSLCVVYCGVCVCTLESVCILTLDSVCKPKPLTIFYGPNHLPSLLLELENLTWSEII